MLFVVQKYKGVSDMPLPTEEQLSHAIQIANTLDIKINAGMLKDSFLLHMWCKSNQGKIVEMHGSDPSNFPPS